MSEDKKRIFPRVPETSERERAQLEGLRGQAKQNLEIEEQEFNTAPAGQKIICQNCGMQNRSAGKFCRQCGGPLSAGQALNDDPDLPFGIDLNEYPAPVYGPPPRPLEPAPVHRPPPVPQGPGVVYGPPAMRLPGGRRIPIFVIVTGLLLGLILIAGLLIAGLIFFPRS